MFTRVSRDPTTPPTNSLGAKIWRVSHETVPKASQHDPSRLMARKRDEPVRLTSIYTRGGDRGETSLGDGSRVSKTDSRIAATGDVDELNSLVGWAQVEARDSRLERVQNELFDLGADLSVPYE